MYAEMQHSIASAERIFKLVDTPADVHDRPDAIDAQTLLGEIEFDHVNFYYEDRKPVLQDFTLKVQPGEMIALWQKEAVTELVVLAKQRVFADLLV